MTTSPKSLLSGVLGSPMAAWQSFKANLLLIGVGLYVIAKRVPSMSRAPAAWALALLVLLLTILRLLGGFAPQRNRNGRRKPPNAAQAIAQALLAPTHKRVLETGSVSTPDERHSVIDLAGLAHGYATPRGGSPDRGHPAGYKLSPEERARDLYARVADDQPGGELEHVARMASHGDWQPLLNSLR